MKKIDKESEELVKEMSGSLNQIKNERVHLFNKIKDVQISMRYLLQLENSRAIKKFGKDHPIVSNLDHSLNVNLGLINDIEVAMELDKINKPQIKKGEILVNGRVIDENRRGISELYVNFSDEDNRVLNLLGRSETDVSGYYSIIIDDYTRKKLSNIVEKGVFLTVCGKKGAVIHREFEPLNITESENIIVNITLNRKDLFNFSRPGSGPAKTQKKSKRQKDDKSKSGATPKIEDLEGIGKQRVKNLSKAGIKDMKAFINADDKKLRTTLRVSDEKVLEMKKEARKLLK